MHDLLFEIGKADEVQVEALLDAVLKRYSQLFPDWEISTISLQKGPECAPAARDHRQQVLFLILLNNNDPMVSF